MAETSFITFSAISASFSLSVLLTGLYWPRTLLSKSRPFSTIVFFISLSDFCYSIINCLGFPLNGTLQCSIQAFGIFYFPLASWLWTVMLVYQLKTLLILKMLHIPMIWIHGICWGIPLVLSLLPLSTNPYGMDDYANGDVACDLSGTRTSKYIWLDLNVSFVAVVCIILMAIWIVEIHLHFRQAENVARELSFLKIIRLYPLALLVTWLPRSILRFLISATILSANSSSRLVAEAYVGILSTQYGSLTAIIYFSHSPASRKLWVNLFRRNVAHFNGEKDASMVSLFNDELTSDDSIEDALVIRAMMEETTTLSERLNPPRSSVRESSTTNVMIQLAAQ